MELEALVYLLRLFAGLGVEKETMIFWGFWLERTL